MLIKLTYNCTYCGGRFNTLIFEDTEVAYDLRRPCFRRELIGCKSWNHKLMKAEEFSKEERVTQKLIKNKNGLEKFM